MTAEQLLTADLPTVAESRSAETGTVEVIRRSFAAVEPQAEELGRHFYGMLFSCAPETRDLFPVNMEVQRSRLLRALVHVVQMVDRPDDLVPFLEQLGRDHRKFGVLDRALRRGRVRPAERRRTLLRRGMDPGGRHGVARGYGTVAKAMAAAAEADRGPASWLGRVVEHRRVGWDLAMITVQPSEPVSYRPGQYVSVETPQRPRLWRYLSPANAPRGDGPSSSTSAR